MNILHKMNCWILNGLPVNAEFVTYSLIIGKRYVNLGECWIVFSHMKTLRYYIPLPPSAPINTSGCLTQYMWKGMAHQLVQQSVNLYSVEEIYELILLNSLSYYIFFIIIYIYFYNLYIFYIYIYNKYI